MADVAELGIRIDSAGAARATSDLQRLRNEAGRTESATDRLADSSHGAARGFGAGGQGARQMAMQLSQVAQQASATGNFVQALAIQLPDMAMGFGTFGIAAGVVASVALPALVSAFTGATEQSKAFENALSALEDTISSTKEIAAIMTGDLDKLAERFGGLDAYARDLANAAAQSGLRKLADDAKALKDEIVGLYDGAIFPQTSRAEDLANGLSLGTKASNELAASLVNLRDQGSLDGQLEAATNLRKTFVAMVGPVGQMTAAQFEFYTKVVDAETMLREAQRRTVELSGAAQAVASAFDAVNSRVASMQSGIKSAASDAWDMAKGLYEAAKARAEGLAYVESNQQGGAGYMASQYAQYGAGRKAGETLAANGFSLPKTPGSAGGGGGGGGVDPFQSRLDALRQSLQTETDMVNQWYADAQAVLADRRSQEIMGETAHRQALLDVEKSYQDQMAAIAANAQQQRLSETSGFFGALAGIAEAGGKRTAKLVATFQAIEGTVNAYGAAIKALNTPGLSLAGRFAAYASVLAAGLKGVAAIRSAGGVGGGGGGKVAAQAAPQDTQSTVEYIVRGIDKNAIYTGEMLSQIFDGISEEAAKRGMATFRFV